jgi:hypothetical protein
MHTEATAIASLVSKSAFLKRHPDFLSKGGLDFLIFKHKSALLAQGAVVKLGPRRIWIDEVQFFAWVRQQELPNGARV